jgi:hypothetical protein
MQQRIGNNVNMCDGCTIDKCDYYEENMSVHGHDILWKGCSMVKPGDILFLNSKYMSLVFNKKSKQHKE